MLPEDDPPDPSSQGNKDSDNSDDNDDHPPAGGSGQIPQDQPPAGGSGQIPQGQDPAEDLSAFSSFAGNTSFNQGNDDYDDINSMSDSRWRLFLDDTDTDLLDATFHSCASGSAGADTTFHSARSDKSDGGDDEEVIVQPPQRGLSNDHEDPKLAETLDAMIHQRRKFILVGFFVHLDQVSNTRLVVFSARANFDIPFPMFKNFKGGICIIGPSSFLL